MVGDCLTWELLAPSFFRICSFLNWCELWWWRALFIDFLGFGSLMPPCHHGSQFSIVGRYVPSWHDASYKICFKLILLTWHDAVELIFFNFCSYCVISSTLASSSSDLITLGLRACLALLIFHFSSTSKKKWGQTQF